MSVSVKYFDRRYYSSANYDTYEEDVRSWVGLVAHKIVRLLKDVPQARVLDVGCAHGFLLEELYQRHGIAIQGLEYSRYAVRTARPSIKKCIKRGSILQKSLFHKNSFDIVACFDVVEYLTKEETHRAIGNLVWWSGEYIFFSALYRHSLQSSQKRNPDSHRITTLSQKEYAKIFKLYGAFLFQKRNLGNGGDILIFKKRH